MKKLLLFIGLVTASLCFNACSDDDKSTTPTGTVAFTINEEQKILSHVVGIFPSQEFQFGNEDYRSAFITNEEGNIAMRITFSIVDNPPFGEGLIQYMEGGNVFSEYDVTTDYIENNGHKLEGTFSGTFTNGMNGQDEQTRTITNGSFDISY